MYAHILMRYNIYEFGVYMSRGSGDLDPSIFTKNCEFNPHYWSESLERLANPGQCPTNWSSVNETRRNTDDFDWHHVYKADITFSKDKVKQLIVVEVFYR